jgi:predicted DNA-binding protein with PD1-like motif
MKTLPLLTAAAFALVAPLSVRAAEPAPAATIATATATPGELSYRKDKDNRFLLVLQPGQKVIESLTAFMEKEQLPGAQFTAIGAVKNAEVAYYNLETKAYQPKLFRAPAEVISLSGSLGYAAGKPAVHAHIALAGPDYQIYGGHLREAEVSIVLEIFITPTSERIVREPSDEFPGVKTIHFDAK